MIPELHEGDCMEVVPTLPKGSVDMVLCDPPYGCTGRNPWDNVIPFDRFWDAIHHAVRPDSAIVLFGQGMFTADLMRSNPWEWRYNLIWEKAQAGGFLNAHRMPLRAHEDIAVFYGRQPVYNPQKTDGHVRKQVPASSRAGSRSSTNYRECNGDVGDYDSTERYPRSVLRYPKDTQKCALHPTQKPVALCSYLIRTYTDPGMVVLDLCMGSGTTGVAAVNEGHGFIGIESDPRYFRIASERIGSATAVPRVTTMESFAEGCQ